MRINGTIKSVVDNYFPGLAQYYRTTRDARQRKRPALRTPYGFELAGHESMAKGLFEARELALFTDLLDGAALVVDIGANIGIYTCLAASHKKHVIAIEPLNSNLYYLTRNIAANGFEERIELFPVALAARPGLSRIYGVGTGASLIEGWAGAEYSTQAYVPVNTLDNLLAHRLRGQNCLIKCDVEGFEYEVLKGSERLLHNPGNFIWLIEICLDEHHPEKLNKRFKETFELFWEAHYESYRVLPQLANVHERDIDRWLLNGTIDGNCHNFLFRRR